MGLISAIKEWADKQYLTHTDLNAEFKNLYDNIVASDLTHKGMIERATDAEIVTGTDTERAITPAGLLARTGTTSRIGLVQLENSHVSTSTTRAACPGNVKEAYDKAVGVAANHSDITSAGANIEDAVTKKHAANADTALGAQSENLNMNTHKIVGVTDPTTNQEAATKKFVDDKIKAPGEIGGTTPAKINCTTIDLDGGQIAFPAAVAASANANTLDDYEEGTYDATIVCSTSGSYTVNADANVLAYVKIGRFVFVSGYLYVSSENSPNGTLRISLPFAATDLSEYSDYTLAHTYLVGHGGTIIGGIGLISGGTAYIQLQALADDGTETAITHASVDTTWEITVSAMYMVE